MGLFSVLSTPWSDDCGYLAWRQAIEVPSEAVDLTKPGAYTLQIGGTPWPEYVPCRQIRTLANHPTCSMETTWALPASLCRFGLDHPCHHSVLCVKKFFENGLREPHEHQNVRRQDGGRKHARRSPTAREPMEETGMDHSAHSLDTCIREPFCRWMELGPRRFCCCGHFPVRH